MAQIEVIRDPNVELSPIVHNLTQPSSTEDPEANDNISEIQQTKVAGILAPIIAVNGVAVDFSDVYSFELDYTGTVPRIKFSFRDRCKMLGRYSQPGNDSEIRVQILPPADNTYKKIDLVFMCTSISVEGETVTGEADYKLAKFTGSQFKALGQVSTYDLFDKISTETGLGFAANTAGTEDARYMQCQFESYKDIVEREMELSCSDADHVYDWWVDVWNNLILCDLYDRINSEDEESDMMVWTTENIDNGSVHEEVTPIKTPAIFTNHPIRENSDLFVLDYDVQNDPASQATGNAVALSVYEENKKEYIDHFIADGDIQKNEFTQFEYAGEVYGDYNYLLARKAREIYIRKVKSEIITIHLNHPQLSINRGDQLRFVWYDPDTLDAINQDHLEEVGVIKGNDELSTILGWVKDWDFSKELADNPLRINAQFSGQYTCIGQYISFNRDSMQWDCWLYLTRPASKRPKILNIKSDDIKNE